MNNILNSIPDKTEDSWTTSLKFKEDCSKPTTDFPSGSYINIHIVI